MHRLVEPGGSPDHPELKLSWYRPTSAHAWTRWTDYADTPLILARLQDTRGGGGERPRQVQFWWPSVLAGCDKEGHCRAEGRSTYLVGHRADKCFEPECFEAVWVLLSMARHPTFSTHVYVTGLSLLAFEVFDLHS